MGISIRQVIRRKGNKRVKKVEKSVYIYYKNERENHSIKFKIHMQKCLKIKINEKNKEDINLNIKYKTVKLIKRIKLENINTKIIRNKMKI